MKKNKQEHDVLKTRVVLGRFWGAHRNHFHNKNKHEHDVFEDARCPWAFLVAIVRAHTGNHFTTRMTNKSTACQRRAVSLSVVNAIVIAGDKSLRWVSHLCNAARHPTSYPCHC